MIHQTEEKTEQIKVEKNEAQEEMIDQSQHAHELSHNQSEIESHGKQEVTVKDNSVRSGNQSSKRLLDNKKSDSNL